MKTKSPPCLKSAALIAMNNAYMLGCPWIIPDAATVRGSDLAILK